MSGVSIHRAAKELLDNPKITPRLEALQEGHRERHDITIDTITIELNEAIKLAKDDIKPAAMITGILGKAKLHGLVVGKAEVVDKTPVVNLSLVTK
jgi:hypothetical protein